MNCKSCSVSNPKDSKFCGNCGASLSSVRPKSNPLGESEQAFKGNGAKPGAEYRKIVFTFSSVFILIVVFILFSISGPQSEQEISVPNETTIEQTEAPVVPTETIGEANAKRKAEQYLSIGGFSKKGLITQLKFEGFTTSEATFGVENIVVNWDEQAAIKAESYMSVQAFSASGLIAQLKFEGFTSEQAAYGAYMVGFRP